MEKGDKILSLLGKVNRRLNKMDAKFDKMEKGIQKNGQLITKIENKIDDKFGALFDGYMSHNEKLDEINDRIGNIDNKMENHDLNFKKIYSVNEDDCDY